MKKKIICRVLTGPTASGKSDFAMRLAEKNNWEILCMDSMQIYRRMDIGTAKPTPDDQKRVKHHLLDLCEPDEPFSVSSYTEEAERTIKSLSDSGREILFTGGTGLYLEALTKPMSMGFIHANETLREILHQLADQPDGRRLLDERLRKCDPATADKLPLNDIRRRIRAIEVSETTGIPFSRQPAVQKESHFLWRIVCIDPPREILYDRINRRVNRMIEAGLPAEVESLLDEGVPESAQSMQAIGYKEMIPFLRGIYPLETAAELIRKGTRHYAKRQMTFFRRLDGLHYIDPFDEDAYTRIENILRGIEISDDEHKQQ